MKRAWLFVPLVVFFVLAVFFYRGLSLDPNELPSALIDKSFPEFSLPSLEDENTLLSRDDVVGKFALVNIWATWCVACKVEHPYLIRLAESGVKVVGVNWKDKNDLALATLEKTGNPYALNIVDKEGRLAFDLGVYGAPETYLVDPGGMIRYKHVGILDAQIWEQKMLPVIQAYRE